MWLTIQKWLSPTKMVKNHNNEYATERRQMVEQQLRGRSIRAPRVLEAMSTVPRHVFVPADVRSMAYADSALPIGYRQTISQPYIVALMTEAVRIRPGDKVLEVGTGSGFGAAVASRIAGQVYTIERHADLAEEARRRFCELGYHNIQVIHSDGSQGWPDAAPYDAIIVTAAAPDLPQPLLDQLADGGRLVIPIGNRAFQTLVRAVRCGNEIRRESLTEVRFVPLVGEYGWQSEETAE